jgi:DNA-binding NarL/FixJ family response regulator
LQKGKRTTLYIEHSYRIMKKIKVALVEDVPDLRNALHLILQSDERIECVGVYQDGETALKEIPALQPHVVIMDIGLPGINGIECVRTLKPQYPSIEFMMCTVHDEDEVIFDALQAGANSYILKRTASDKLIEAIIELHEGGSPMSSDIARKLVRSYQKKNNNIKEQYGITTREEEILMHLSKGLTYQEVADALFISVGTIKKHIYNIYEKLRVSSKVEAINKYLGK